MGSQGKIVSLASLKKKIAPLRKRKVVAFTNGCFDILHPGHVCYLERAKKAGRLLIVGLNSDRSVRRIKGPKRPIMKEGARARVLAGLACVDYVILFDEETPEKLIASIKPDVLIKGADWKGKGIAGSAAVRAWGGKIEFIKFVDGYSSSKIIKRIENSGRSNK